MSTVKICAAPRITDDRGEVIWNGEAHGLQILMVELDLPGSRSVRLTFPIRRDSPDWVPALVLQAAQQAADETARLLA